MIRRCLLFVVFLATGCTQSLPLTATSPVPTPEMGAIFVVVPSAFLANCRLYAQSKPPLLTDEETFPVTQSQVEAAGIRYAIESLGMNQAAICVQFVELIRFPIMGRAVALVTIANAEKRSEPIGFEHFQVAVDMHSGNVVDIGDLYRAEEVAFEAKYGKIDPSLYDFMQTMEADEVREIAIVVYVPAELEEWLTKNELVVSDTTGAFDQVPIVLLNRRQIQELAEMDFVQLLMDIGGEAVTDD